MATIDQRHDAELRRQRDALDDNHSGNTRMYRDMQADSDAAYEALKTQARIDRALSELAGGPTRSSATLRARDESAMRNEIGDTERQRARFADNVDHALAGLARKKDADEVIAENMDTARQTAAEISQQRFDAELNLQKQYHELDKKNSLFDQMYKLYTKRLVNKDTFKAMTGIEVKAMPKPHRRVVRKANPTIIVVGANEPATKTKGYETMSYRNAVTGETTYCEVKEEVATQMKEKGVGILNENGQVKDEQRLYLDLNIDGYKDADAATRFMLLEDNRDDFVNEFGEGAYWAQQLQLIWKMPGSSLKNMKPIEELTDFAKGAQKYIDANGEEPFYQNLSLLIDAAFEEVSIAAETMGKDNVYSMGVLQEAIPEVIVQYQYTDSKADETRRENGIVPEAFSWDDAVTKMELPKWYVKPEKWDEDSINELINTCTEHKSWAAVLGDGYDEQISDHSRESLVGWIKEKLFAGIVSPIDKLKIGGFSSIENWEQLDTTEILALWAYNDFLEKGNEAALNPMFQDPYSKMVRAGKDLSEQLEGENQKYSALASLADGDFLKQQKEQEEQVVNNVILNTRNTFVNYLDQNTEVRQVYSDTYKTVFGTEPIDKDMKALASRIQASRADKSVQSAAAQKILNEISLLPTTKLLHGASDIMSAFDQLIIQDPAYNEAMDDVRDYAKEHVGYLFTQDFRGALAAKFKELTGKTVEEATGYSANELTPEVVEQLGKPLSEKDQAFFDKASQYTAGELAEMYEKVIAEGQEQSTLGTALTTTAAMASKNLERDFLSLAGEIIAIIEGKDGYWDRWTDINAQIYDLDAQLRMTRLASTADYQPWMSTATSVTAGGLTVAADIALGKIIGSAMKLASGTNTLLANPNIKKGIINVIMPTEESKVLFLQNLGGNLSKYSDDEYGAAIAMAESLAFAWVESSGGLASGKTLIEQGIGKIAKTKGGQFLQKWLNDMGHEIIEEGVQSGISTGFEAITGKNTSTFEQEFGSAGAAATTAVSVALMTAVFTLAGMGADIDPIIVQYEQGNFEKARQLTAETIDSAIEFGTLSQENISILKELKANIVTTKMVDTDSGDITVDVQDGDIRVPELLEIGAAGSVDYRRMTAEQIEQSVQSNIGNNVQIQPEVVQKALVEGMSALVKIETRLKIESRNINYSGLNVDASQAAYIDFQTAKGTAKAAKLGVAAEAMVTDIKAAFETQALTEAETAQLTGVLADIVGDAGLAQAYIGVSTNAKNSGRLSRLSTQYSANHENKAFADNPFDASGRLRPDAKYKSGEFGYNYETDSLRRITNFNSDDLRITDRGERLKHNPNTLGKLPGDHAGHLAGDLFGGSSALDNLVSQSQNVNLHEYRKLEIQWVKAIKEGKKVSVNVDVKYDGDSLRPSQFIIEYMINGARYTKFIDN